MLVDIRYYAVWTWGRARLSADTDEGAIKEVKYQLEKYPGAFRLIRIVKEVRTDIPLDG